MTSTRTDSGAIEPGADGLPVGVLRTAALASIVNAVMVADADGRIVWVNDAFTTMSGYAPDEAKGHTPRLLKSGVQDRAHYEQLWSTIKAGTVWQGEVVNRHKDGHHYRVAQTISPVFNGGASPTYFVAIHDDVTQQRAVEHQQRFQAQLLDAVGDAVIATDLDGTVLYVNPAAEQMYGWKRADVLGLSVTEVTVPTGHASQANDILDQLRDGTPFTGRFEVQRADGSRFPALVTTSPYNDTDGQIAGFIGVSVDVTEQVAMQDQLARSNRELKAITDSIGDGLCVLDADGRITYINPRGQRLLDVYVTEALGVRLAAWLSTDTEPRSGSPTLIDPVRPVEAMLVLREGTRVPIEYVATPMIGKNDHLPTGWVVVFRDITERREREAKIARQVDQALMLGRIQHALDTDGFVLYAQPIVDVQTGEVVQHELLIRMRDPDDPDAIIPPGAFLPVAEELGLAPAIDRWVLLHGLRLAATGMPVQINLSTRSLDDPTLPHLLEQLLAETGADPASVMLEITETALINSDLNAERFAVRVRELGCRLALDDFGTGYGGFTYLKQLPIDELKIDIEFVRDAVTNPASRHVIDAVVSLARAFGLHTVGEGVEDQATLDILKDHDVDYAQGYHLGRPEPIEAKIELAQSTMMTDPTEVPTDRRRNAQR